MSKQTLKREDFNHKFFMLLKNLNNFKLHYSPDVQYPPSIQLPSEYYFQLQTHLRKDSNSLMSLANKTMRTIAFEE